MHIHETLLDEGASFLQMRMLLLMGKRRDLVPLAGGRCSRADAHWPRLPSSCKHAPAIRVRKITQFPDDCMISPELQLLGDTPALMPPERHFIGQRAALKPSKYEQRDSATAFTRLHAGGPMRAESTTRHKRPLRHAAMALEDAGVSRKRGWEIGCDGREGRARRQTPARRRIESGYQSPPLLAAKHFMTARKVPKSQGRISFSRA